MMAASYKWREVQSGNILQPASNLSLILKYIFIQPQSKSILRYSDFLLQIRKQLFIILSVPYCDVRLIFLMIEVRF